MLTFQRRRGIVSKQRKYEVKRCPGFFPAPPTLTRFEMRAVVEEVLHTRDLIATSAENLHPFTAHKNFPENHSLSSPIFFTFISFLRRCLRRRVCCHPQATGRPLSEMAFDFFRLRVIVEYITLYELHWWYLHIYIVNQLCS